MADFKLLRGYKKETKGTVHYQLFSGITECFNYSYNENINDVDTEVDYRVST